ncbi:M3 family oligoendopeptidase [Acidisoma silvae]|nr:M3 family oligoendopeptidase [Acidisoma silvae]
MTDGPASGGASGQAELLPSWDLADLYDGVDSPALLHDLETSKTRAAAFRSDYAGKLDGLAAGALAGALREYEAIEETLGRVMSYAQLLFSGDSSDAKISRFYQSMSEKVTEISTDLLFFTLELNCLDEQALAAKMADPALGAWKSWLDDLRIFKPHQLSDDMEQLLHEKEVTGASAWSRLFDETMAGLRVSVADESLTVSDALNRLSDRNRETRQAAAGGISQTFAENIRLFSLITNTLAKDKETIDRWRHYPTPASYRNRSNMVEDEVVDALVSAVTSNYGRLSHRYYSLKAQWLGLPKLQHWDRNAPLPADTDQKISWADARARVLSAYGAFSPVLAEIGQRFFDRPWIDAGLRPGKSGGAFAHPTVPSAHPYILMNYHGRTRDVMTLAHELGHGVHQVLAGEAQGYLRSGTPLTLAETASVFGEMLTFRAILDAETDPARRRIMLASKVEDMLNTVVRQIAFFQFETKVHAERRSGELLPERLGEIWMDVQTASLGDAFEFTPDYAAYWAYIPHFIHSPFYVYAYAFGDCLVNALYAEFAGGHPRFQEKYLDMLRAGGTKRHKELLAPFGLNAADPAFWTCGLDVLAGFIDELEAAGTPAAAGKGA